MHSENMQAYKTMNLNEKYEFAFGGYVFEKYPKHKAIYMDFTHVEYHNCRKLPKTGTEF